MAVKLKLTGASGNIELSDQAFGVDYNEALVHQVVTACLAGARQGTKRQKNRSDARGGGTKPWRQKGTGRARAGTIRSPIWVGGGRAFAARPRDYSQKVNKKMYRGALRSMLSELVRQERFVVVDELTLDAPKTRLLAERLKELGLANVLIITEAFDEALYLAARNLAGVGIIDVTDIDPVTLIRFDKILLTVAALKVIEERLQ